MPAAIRISHLSKQYTIRHVASYGTLRDTITDGVRRMIRRRPRGETLEPLWALRDINLVVQPGERVGVIGRNGAGKSTFLKVISRITPPTAGEVRLTGRVASLLEVGTGFHPELTGRENIFLNGAVLGMGQREIRKNFDDIVAFAEIERFLDTPVKRYSSGMYVRLAFAVSAFLESEILVVDEVLAVGDIQFQKKCLSKMRTVTSAGRTLLFVSHNLSAIRTLCDRVILFRDGAIVADGPPDAVISVYVGDADGTTFERSWTDQRAPRNGSAVLRRVAITDRHGRPLEVLTTDSEFATEIDFTITKDRSSVGTTLLLYDSENNCVFGSISNHEPNWYGQEMPAGTYRSRCLVPGRLLNNGRFSLSVTLFGKGFTDAVTANEVLTFNVQDGPDVRGDFFGAYAGNIRPDLQWETIRMGGETATSVDPTRA